MKIFLSGVHSGPNPSPGLGVARSLRTAYPDARLVAVDYSSRSSGLHHEVFDDIWLQAPWDMLDLDLYRMQIERALLEDALWISGLDLETAWLAQNPPASHSLLVPPQRALELVSKPSIIAHRDLPISVPPFMSLLESDFILHAFCRRHDWHVWLKGPYYEARRVRSWAELDWERAELSATWSTENLFLQAHVTGYEESVALAAYQGMIIDCVYMSKRDLTSEGKTWAGKVSQVPREIRTPLALVVADLNWTGGAELECVRDSTGCLWLIDWNPRFPAWIYGSTLAGRNLPALLVMAATGRPALEAKPISHEFIRVVQEIPTKPSVPLPPPAESSGDTFGWHAKHPSGMPRLARRLAPQRSAPSKGQPAELPTTLLEDLSSLDGRCLETPLCHVLEKTAHKVFNQSRETLTALGASLGIPIELAYSVKTNPSAWLLRAALENGMLAEAISQLEVEHATQLGFAPSRIILNGPAKRWPHSRDYPLRQLGAVFCDSIEELRRVIEGGNCPEILGFRIRPPGLNSRFGISLDRPAYYDELVSLLKIAPANCQVGISLHIASSHVGTRKWLLLLEALLGWGHRLERASQRRITSLDLGGGWSPDDWIDLLLPNIGCIASSAKSILKQLDGIILEPGRALAQSSTAVIARTLEIRRSPHGSRDVVVDGAISELPDIRSYPHRFAAQASGATWQPLTRGEDRILGRLCMESDILAASVHWPDEVREGELLAICDAGAYDRSMSYVFGQG